MTDRTWDDLRLNVRCDTSGSYDDHYFTVKIFPVTIERGDNGTWLRSPSFWSFERGPGDLQDFMISAQTDSKSKALYAWKAEFDNASVSLERAEQMVKTLRKLQRGLEKIDAEFGRADDFVTFAIRVAKVLNLKFIIPSTMSEYRELDANAFRYHVDAEVQAWRDKIGVQA